MSQDRKWLKAWQRTIAPALRELGASEEVQQAMEALRSGRKHKSEVVREGYETWGALDFAEAMKVFPILTPPSRPRGRPRGRGQYVPEDEKLLQIVDGRVANGEHPKRVIAELAHLVGSNDGAKGARARLWQKYRMRNAAKFELF